VRHYKYRRGVQINLHRGATVLLEVTGRLVIEAPSQLRVDLAELMTYGGRSLLILDLAGVSQMDCSGIGQLVKLFVRVRRLGGRFALVNVQRRQRRLLDMCGLLTLFPAYECTHTGAFRMQNHGAA
jgi:anti-sigma B factor antagonist